MQIEERFLISAPVDQVWAFLLDTQSVADCVPGCEAVECSGENSYTARMKVKVGPISANFDVQIDITEMAPPARLKSVIKGKDSRVASSLNASTVLDLVDLGSAGTEFHYRTDVSVFGRLGKFGEGVMREKAREYGERFAASVKEKLEGGGAAEPSGDAGNGEDGRSVGRVRRLVSWAARLPGCRAAAGKNGD
ncbi:MAG: SRPBCC family protein [Deltaproteobacteria bacterium]|nr:SRPBCC family protein [Deltaproteobacteria bacterium]